jgi:receptor expression-enhancing protein 5/6
MTKLRLVADSFRSGAQVVFHSFLQPVVGRFFSSNGTSSNLRAQAEAASKPHST